MGQISTIKHSWFILFAMAVGMNLAFSVPLRADTIYRLHLNSKTGAKTTLLHNGIKATLPPFKPAAVIIKPAPKTEDDRLLSNVQVYPTPVTDQINLKYTVSRNTNVTIRIMDVLGNNVATLFSQRVEPGDQKFTYYLNNKLTSGFYFVRVVVGTESVIKRISIL
ncbi:T9SS type A sorting domain-containing protein [Mucilaginibacter sp.]